MSSSKQLQILVDKYGFIEIQNDLQLLKNLKMIEILTNIKTYKEGIKIGSIEKKQWDLVIPLYKKEVDKIIHSKTNNLDNWYKIVFNETIIKVDDIEHTDYFIQKFLSK